MKNCISCQALIPEEHPFCGACGRSVVRKSLDDIVSDVSEISRQVELLNSELEKKSQTLLEWETSQKIVDRFEKWAKSVAFFVGIPLGLVLLALSIALGRSFITLRDIVESAKSTVQPIVEKAKQEASSAEKSAEAATRTSDTVRQQINSTHEQLDRLSQSVQARSATAEQLASQITKSQRELDSLRQRVVDQSAVVQRLQEATKMVKVEQSEQNILQMYPSLGTHYVVGGTGVPIDAKQKASGSSYISLMLPPNAAAATVMRPKIKPIAALTSELESEGNRVFVGNISLNGRAGNSVTGILGFSGNTCGNIGKTKAPCILYTSPEKKDGAFALRRRFASIQDIPETQVQFVDPSKLGADIRELIELSGIDYFVELKFGVEAQ